MLDNRFARQDPINCCVPEALMSHFETWTQGVLH